MYLSGSSTDKRDAWIKLATESITFGRHLFYIEPGSTKRVMFGFTFRKSVGDEARLWAEQIYDTRDVYIERSKTIPCQHYWLKG